MTPIDVAGDSAGYLASLVAGVGGLHDVLEALVWALAILIAVEVARGVMRR